MRRLILAATLVASLATLAVPAISAAAVNPDKVVSTPFTASYNDGHSGLAVQCKGVHEVKTAKIAANSYVIDREHCKTNPKVVQFTPFQNLTIADFGGGWIGDSPFGGYSTQLTGHANSHGTGYSLIVTYPVS